MISVDLFRGGEMKVSGSPSASKSRFEEDGGCWRERGWEECVCTSGFDNGLSEGLDCDQSTKR